jgi:hypothetical protein
MKTKKHKIDSHNESKQHRSGRVMRRAWPTTASSQNSSGRPRATEAQVGPDHVHGGLLSLRRERG